MEQKVIIGTNLTLAKSMLVDGKAISIPTETVYGLAANAFNGFSVSEIFRIKKRPTFDPLIVHTHSLECLPDFVAEIPEQARLLAAAFWPGPLTLLLEKKEIIPDLVTSGLNRVAIRIPNHSLALDLLRMLPFPVAAPSANPFGYISPTTAQHVADQLGNDIEYILDGGPCNIGIESTIVGWENGVPTIFRTGGLSIKAIEQVIGKVQVQFISSSNPAAPGMLKSHYAPAIPMYAGNIPELLLEHSGKRIGVLSFQTNYSSAAVCIRLSESGDTYEAAQHLFAAMRTLDTSKVDVILTEFAPEEGLGNAINDRLRRACAR